jgi:Uma2 family endonuclease
VTVEQFRDLTLDDGPSLRELHYGRDRRLARPKAKHYRLQRRLERRLEARAGDRGVVGVEVPFRAVPQFDLRAADAALISQGRWDASIWRTTCAAPLTWSSRSNRHRTHGRNLRERACLCLANGCQDFWIVDSQARTKAVQCLAAECVALPVFDGDGLRVPDVFT